MSDARSRTRCTVCAASDYRPLFSVRDYSIVECKTCTHAWVESMPTEEELAALYRETAESFLGSGLAGPMATYLGDDDRRFFAFHADRLAAVEAAGAVPSTRILDFGCSQGAFVATLVKKGYRQVTGFDRSASAVREGRVRWNIDLEAGSLDEYALKDAGRFEIVHAANVLEHVVDPGGILRDLRKLLRPSGRLVVCVPNTRSLQVGLAKTRSPVIDPPHHLQYYGPRSLAQVVTSAGFEVTTMRTEFWLPASDLFLHMKGIPLWLGKAVRHGMAVPGAAINALKLGGVISLCARRPGAP